MSAFLVTTNHVDAMIALAREDRIEFKIAADESEARVLGYVDTVDAVGKRLIAANVANLEFLYPRHPVTLAPYHFRQPTGSLPRPVEGIKLVECFSYQCCDLPEFEGSWADRFCRKLISSLIGRLPGYDAAPWGI